jgi:hypothetical protein
VLKMTTKTEIIHTREGDFVCEVIELDALHPVTKDMVGERPTEEDYDRLIQNNVSVYVGGKRKVVFLKGAMTEIGKVEPGTDSYTYWKWVSKKLRSNQRGLASGKELTSPNRFRLISNGQLAFFKAAEQGLVTTREEVEQILANHSGSSKYAIYKNKVLSSGYVNVEKIAELDEITRKKSLPESVLEEAWEAKNQLFGEWFDNWLEDWLLAENKAEYAANSFKIFVSKQGRANGVLSNVLGFIDRAPRVPYGRLSSSTKERYDDFVSHKPFYLQASDLYKDTLPEEWEYIHNVMKNCKDERYTLLGTKTFSTITINYNFPTFFHYDGNNNPRGVAVLTALTNESYPGEKFDGSYFVLPELRLAFDIRKGDFFVGDNCNLMHGQTEQINKTKDADNIIFVFYARDGMSKLEDYDTEVCRRSFVLHVRDNLSGKYQKSSSGKFTGVFPGMWSSEEWAEYKAKHCPQASNTNYHYTEG